MLLPGGASGSGQNGGTAGAESGIETQPSVAARWTAAVGSGSARGAARTGRPGPAAEPPSGSSAQVAAPVAPASRARRLKPRREARSHTVSSLRVRGRGGSGWYGCRRPVRQPYRPGLGDLVGADVRPGHAARLPVEVGTWRGDQYRAEGAR